MKVSPLVCAAVALGAPSAATFSGSMQVISIMTSLAGNVALTRPVGKLKYGVHVRLPTSVFVAQ